jgi:hypothetical protein
MRGPWLRDWSCGATRQLCKMAGSKNIGESAGTTVRIVRRAPTPRGFVGRWSWRIDTTSDVIVRSREVSRHHGLGGHRGYARPGHR